jgi:hypothetical protein
MLERKKWTQQARSLSLNENLGLFNVDVDIKDGHGVTILEAFLGSIYFIGRLLFIF